MTPTTIREVLLHLHELECYLCTDPESTLALLLCLDHCSEQPVDLSVLRLKIYSNYRHLQDDMSCGRLL